MKRNSIETMSLFLWVTVLTLAVVMAHGKWINPQKRLVTADLISLVKEQVVLLARQTKGKSVNRQLLTKSINVQLRSVLQKIATQYQVIIVPKQAVLAGDAEDITEVIRAVLVNNGNSLVDNLALSTDRNQ